MLSPVPYPLNPKEDFPHSLQLSRNCFPFTPVATSCRRGAGLRGASEDRTCGAYNCIPFTTTAFPHLPGLWDSCWVGRARCAATWRCRAGISGANSSSRQQGCLTFWGFVMPRCIAISCPRCARIHFNSPGNTPERITFDSVERKYRLKCVPECGEVFLFNGHLLRPYTVSTQAYEQGYATADHQTL